MLSKLLRLPQAIDWYFSKYILRKKTIKRSLKYFEMHLDLQVEGISRTLAFYKTREEDMIQIIQEYLKEGMTVLDCGSNIGFYPLLEVEIMKNNGQIYAFEPDERNFVLLEKNIQLCPYGEAIKPYNMAVSNKSGTERMFVATASNLNKLYSNDDQDFIERHTVEESVDVETITVDDFCSRENVQIDFLRMDIEGYEVEVFQGMRDTFKNAQSGFMVLLELHPHAYSEDRSFASELKLLFDQGFIAKVLISAGVPIPKSYSNLGYKPIKEVQDGNFTRGWYENISKEHVIELTCSQPKASRYILIQKK